jgi:hypothetical protein
MKSRTPSRLGSSIHLVRLEPWHLDHLDHLGPCRIDHLETIIPRLSILLDAWVPTSIVASRNQLHQGSQQPSHPGSQGSRSPHRQSLAQNLPPLFHRPDWSQVCIGLSSTWVSGFHDNNSPQLAGSSSSLAFHGRQTAWSSRDPWNQPVAAKSTNMVPVAA